MTEAPHQGALQATTEAVAAALHQADRASVQAAEQAAEAQERHEADKKHK